MKLSKKQVHFRHERRFFKANGTKSLSRRVIKWSARLATLRLNPRKAMIQLIGCV